MKPTEQTKNHVIFNYIAPARRKGETTVQLRVGDVQKGLGWTNRTPSVFSTLLSKDFQREAGVKLVEKSGGPPSGGPSTTWNFVYQLLAEDGSVTHASKTNPNESSFDALFGLCAQTFKALGGGEEYLRRQREAEPDAWERYEAERQVAGAGK